MSSYIYYAAKLQKLIVAFEKNVKLIFFDGKRTLQLRDKADAFVDFVIHGGVVFNERHPFAVGLHPTLDFGGGFQRTAEFQGLGGVEKLDGENLLQVPDDAQAFGGGIGAHAHVVLLPL